MSPYVAVVTIRSREKPTPGAGKRNWCTLCCREWRNDQRNRARNRERNRICATDNVGGMCLSWPLCQFSTSIAFIHSTPPPAIRLVPVYRLWFIAARFAKQTWTRRATTRRWGEYTVIKVSYTRYQGCLFLYFISEYGNVRLVQGPMRLCLLTRQAIVPKTSGR